MLNWENTNCWSKNVALSSLPLSQLNYLYTTLLYYTELTEKHLPDRLSTINYKIVPDHVTACIRCHVYYSGLQVSDLSKSASWYLCQPGLHQRLEILRFLQRKKHEPYILNCFWKPHSKWEVCLTQYALKMLTTVQPGPLPYLNQGCVDNSWRYTVDIQSPVGPLCAQGLGDLDYSCLRGVVGNLLLWVRYQQRRHAGCVDDLAIPLCQHVLALLLQSIK